ncbi:hypothetical protein OBBRIDRAFT_839153 [Obba rivulosa]|uniref:Uncharacterized protein n=1 Tax=Obba rivulosa TaxID=1052685 RepID=A0A8E2AIL3_9APHY|nr:hypothetical protein OBBRIDRAFT_839153 [Obba rivulosa]
MDASGPTNEETEVEPQVDPAYLAHYNGHLDHTRSHLVGKDGSDTLPASFFPPNASWTSAEKDMFFRALTVHSRLRPDLIAEEIKTKTIVDVCVYLDVLEEASSSHPLSLTRKHHPIALEVSNEFVAYEEGKSQALAVAEPHLEEQALQQSREEEIRAHRLATRARKGQARTAANERDREGEKLRKKEFKVWLEQRKAEWEDEQALTLLNLPMLKVLDHILREDEETPLLETKATEQQGGQEVEAGNREATPSTDVYMPQTLLADPDSRLLSEDTIDPSLRTTPAPTLTSETFMVEAPTHSSSLPIHPTFQPSTPPLQSRTIPIFPQEPRSPSRSTVPPDATGDDISVAEAELSPASRRRYRKRMYMRRKRAVTRGVTVVEGVERMKPGRRPKKKPERSAQTPAPENGDMNVDGDEMVQQKPVAAGASTGTTDRGCTTSPQADAAVEDRLGADQNSGDDGVAGGRDNGTRHPHVSGKTLPYKLLARLEQQGVNAEWLRAEGFELLHLRGIGKLMRLYSVLDEEQDDLTTQIHVDVVKLLSAHVVDFVTRAIHRIVVVREQERLAKVQTKVWRLAENQVITVPNVEHALGLMGQAKLSKAAHFEGLLERLNIPAEDNASSDEEDASEELPARSTTRSHKRKRDDSGDSSHSDDEDADDQGDEEMDSMNGSDDESLDPLHLPSHRRICAPFVRLPSRLYPSTSDLPQGFPHSVVFMPFPASTTHTIPESEPQDDLITDETDEALRHELSEEQALDACDRLIEANYERAFWALVKAGTTPNRSAWDGVFDAAPGAAAEAPLRRTKKRKRGSVGDTDKERRRPDKLRYIEPDPSGPVKSAVYVVDSD